MLCAIVGVKIVMVSLHSSPTAASRETRSNSPRSRVAAAAGIHTVLSNSSLNGVYNSSRRFSEGAEAAEVPYTKIRL